jgi:hypothetical protein
MLQVHVSNVLSLSNVWCKCFICILHMLQWLCMYAVSVCSKCFTCFRPMLQVFHLDVAYVACCICFRHMLPASIQNVSSVSDVCCKYVYLDVVVAIHICCKCIFVNVSHVSDACCRNAFMLQH